MRLQKTGQQSSCINRQNTKICLCDGGNCKHNYKIFDVGIRRLVSDHTNVPETHEVSETHIVWIVMRCVNNWQQNTCPMVSMGKQVPTMRLQIVLEDFVQLLSPAYKNKVRRSSGDCENAYGQQEPDQRATTIREKTKCGELKETGEQSGQVM